MPRDMPYPQHVERVALFIDMSNLYFAARQINIRVDYERLREFVARGRSLLRAFAYMGIDPEDAQTMGLVNYLKRYAGYKVVTKVLRRYEDGSAKANLDIEMAIDMLTIAEHVDTIVLISGDGDFTRLVETVQFKGVRVEVIGLGGNTATSLIEAADVFTDLADVVGDIQKVERAVPQRRFDRPMDQRWGPNDRYQRPGASAGYGPGAPVGAPIGPGGDPRQTGTLPPGIPQDLDEEDEEEEE